MLRSQFRKSIYPLTIPLAWLSVMISFFANAQQPAAGFSREPLSTLEKKLNLRSSNEHSNIQPAAFGLEESFYSLSDSAYSKNSESNNFNVDGFGSLAGGFQVSEKQQPIANALAGLQLGLQVRNKLSVALGYAFNGIRPPTYIEQMAEARINPGVGYAVGDKNGLYHTHYTFGHIAYNRGKYFEFEVGKGKHFWGDGYRSLLLSDNAAPYPYARITTKVWRLKYTNLWAQMRDMTHGQLLGKARIKYTASHSLSWNVGKKFNMAIYEMVVWQDRDTMSHRALDINYLNPIIFYRPVEYSVGSPDNVIIGLSMRWKFSDRLQLYGQFALDEFNLQQIRLKSKWWANKYGGQIGFKAFDVFLEGLSLQSEINAARPFTYTHGSPVQSYTHLNQSLAHPLGANFGEWVTFVRYDKNKWRFQEQFIWATYGRDTDINGDGALDNLGGNILRSYKAPYHSYGNVMYQGLRSIVHYNSFTIARKIFPQENFEVFLTHILRYEKNAEKKSMDNFFVLGIQTTGLLQPARDY